MRITRRQFLCLGLIPLVVSLACSTASAAEIRLRHRLSVYSAEQQMPLHLPEGIGSLSASALIVADTGNGRLLRYESVPESENEYAFRFVSAYTLPPQFYPTKIQVRPDGEVLVLDRRKMTVFRFGPGGEFRGPVPVPGGGGETVKSFALDGDGNLYMIRYGAGRVQVMGPDGGLRREIAVPEESVLLLDLAVDRNGRVLAVDGVHGVVYAAGPSETTLAPITGSLKPYARFPSRITTDDRGRIYLSDRNGCRIAILGQDGSFLASASTRGFKEGLLQYPAQISISGDALFVADTRNHRFQVFTIVE